MLEKTAYITSLCPMSVGSYVWFPEINFDPKMRCKTKVTGNKQAGQT